MTFSHWLDRCRRLPVSLLLAVAAAVAAAVDRALDLFHAAIWLRVFVGLVIAVVAMAIAVDNYCAKKKSEDEKRAEEAAAEADRLQAIQRHLVWPAPPLRGVDPFQQLGVAKSQLAERYVSEGQRHPPYVERDIDQLARKRLQSHGLLLLIGAPASGVTRTAYELALGVPTSPLLLAPVTPRGLSTALSDLDVMSRLQPGARLLLWLDDVDYFTDLTANMLYRLQEQSPGLRVVATVSSTGYEAWAASNKLVAGAFGDPVELERLPSNNELKRAAVDYPEVDFSEGIAAAFTATAALLARKRGGFHDCPFEAAGDECALARAVVDIALSWSFTDIDRPLPVDQLHALASGRRGGRHGIDDEHLALVLGWATTPAIGGTSLLTLASGCNSEQAVIVASQIAEIHRAEVKGPDELVWKAAFECAVRESDSAAIGRIGFRAHEVGYMSGAARAWAAISSVDDPAAKWLRLAASFSHEQGDALAELPARQRLCELAEDAYGPDDTRVGRALFSLAHAYLNAGQVHRARGLLERALEIQERENGAKHLDVAATLIHLGQVWIHLGKPERARDLLARATQISLEDSHSDATGTASILMSLGHAYYLLGDFAPSRDALKRALQIQEQDYGSNHPIVADTLSELSNPYNALGEPSEARKLLERALKIQEGKLNDNHLDIATTLLNLGNTLVRLGEAPKAREPLERALRIRESRLGRDDLQVAHAFGSLGIMWTRLGDPAKGRTLLERALATQEGKLGPDHPEIATTLMHLSDACFDLEDRTRSGALIERVLAIQEGKLGPDHPDLARTLTRLSNVRLWAGEPAENVLPLLKRAMGILRRRFPDGHPLISNVARAIRQVSPGTVIFDNGIIADGSTDPEVKIN
jgi:tetratricopeptide (TPR) repeat protein